MNIAILHPQCRVRGGAIKMALLSAQSLQKQGHRVMFYTFDHDPDCFPELQEGLSIVTAKTRKKEQRVESSEQNIGSMPVIPAKDAVREVESTGKPTTPSKDKKRDDRDSEKISEGRKSTFDILDKKISFWELFQSIFPRFSLILGIAWDIRQVDIVIAHNPPMHIVGALARIFSILSPYHQRLTLIWWHHHVPWYYEPKAEIQQKPEEGKSLDREKMSFRLLENLVTFTTVKGWKSYFERYWIIPRIKYMIATSHYTAYCVEQYCGRKAVVIHPVISPPSSGTGFRIQVDNNNSIQSTSGGVDLDPGSRTARASIELNSTRDAIRGITSARDDGKTRPLTLFSHGRLEPGKSFDTLVKVWKELRDNPGVHVALTPGLMGLKLVIAGEGSLKNWLIEQGVEVIAYQESVLEDIKTTQSDTLAIYLSTIDAFGICPLEAQIAELPTIILDRGGARETVLLDKNGEPKAQLVHTEKEIMEAITYFIQHRSLHKSMSNVNFCHHTEYFSVSRLDSDIRSMIDSVG